MELLLHEWLLGWGLNPETSKNLAIGLALLVILLASLFIGNIFRLMVFRFISSLIKSSKTKMDDILLNKNFFRTLGWMIPPIIFSFTADSFIQEKTDSVTLLLRISQFILILTGARLIEVFLGNIQSAFQADPRKKTIPLAGYVQVAKVFVYFVAFILGASVLLDQDPWGLLSGIGALTAVLLLVFKDSLLGLTASVQISSNNLVNLGDWIEVPAYGADGEVIEISITQIKVKNWNHTISSIPTYALVSGTFKNWKGMTESGARRIKRALNLDMNTIRFLHEDDYKKLGTLPLLAPYLAAKREDLNQANQGIGQPEAGRQLTNIGTFRAYVEAYLRHHPGIHQDFTLLVRQLDPKETGLPLEIYCFTRTTAWSAYEEIQADIFDHLLAMAPYFNLHVYQAPSGLDFRALTSS